MSALFKPYRALGYISDPVPFVVRKTGTDFYVITSVGKAWQGYNCDKLRLVHLGPEFGKKIRALASRRKHIYAAVGNRIEVCYKQRRIGTITGHGGKIVSLLCIADLILSIGKDGKLMVWDDENYQTPQMTAEFGDGFTPVCMVHPDTYINKVLVGSLEGSMQLWNFQSGKLVHTFKGWGSSVQCMEASPALDVVAVGLGDGRAVVFNLKYDEVVCTFGNASGTGMHMVNDRARQSGGACTALAFSSGVGTPLLAAGGAAGVITIWNLEEKRLSTVINAAHDAPLVSLFFFPKSPLLMSSAGDNSIKHWIFDNLDGSARFLRSNTGHRAPPNCIKFYKEGNRILSAGQDRAFWMFPTSQHHRGMELSQGHIKRTAKRLKRSEEDIKLRRVIQMDACEVRERDWANAITAHDGDRKAYTWKLRDHTIGEHVLELPFQKGKGNPGVVTSVCLSRCGNFALVGRSSGRLDKFNMQSGMHRGEFRRVFSSKDCPAHDGQISGLSSDASNRHVVTGGYDGFLRIWHFKSRRLACQLQLNSPINHLSLHPGTCLCGVSCDDWAIRMVDIVAGRVVRRFGGHEDRITCLEISQDGRWLLSSSMDGTVRVWDIPSSQIFQIMQLDVPVTSMSISPSMDFLATSHVDRRGVYLWTNQMMFGSAVEITPSEKPVNVSLPAIASDEVEEEGDGQIVQAENFRVDSMSDVAATTAFDPSVSPTPILPGLVTLSMLPRIQWHNLANLELIKARNKPIQPPKKPEAAPFFLPTVGGLSRDPVFNVTAQGGVEDEEEKEGKSKSRVLEGMEGATTSTFASKLKEFEVSGDPKPFSEFLRTLGPSAIDREIHEMEYVETPFAEGKTSEADELPEEVQSIGVLLEFIDTQIAARTDFEFIQAFLRLVLQVHDTTIMEWPQLFQTCERIKGRLKASWSQVDDLIQSVHCMVNYFTSWQG
ncbi:hypothetical protein BSKO_13530 [Bryopsis sp. KO-2023]|nr:hypothetical protein BSKO_13530 [Bryopsis sp. KO-2023]